MLPDGSGLELCEALKHRWRSLGIPILITAHETERNIQKYSCADGFISKPFDLDLILQKIKALLYG